VGDGRRRREKRKRERRRRKEHPTLNTMFFSPDALLKLS